VADVNGDGFADVVMPGPAGNNGPSLAVMLGQADGQLGAATITPGLLAGVMVAGDVDGDGSVDIVSATLDANSNPIISVLLNDGKGNFSQSSTIPFTGDYPGSLTLVDVDGDGKPDLLFSTKDPVQAIWYLHNLGGGSFAAPVSLAVPNGATRVFAVGDFNGDGRPDVIYAAFGTATAGSQFHLLLNQGGGSFTDQIATGISAYAGYFAVGDFNGDGHLDVVVEPDIPYQSLSSASVTVFFGQGNGSFVAGPSTLVENNPFQAFQYVVGDFDGDGNLDVAGINADTEPGHVVVLWGDGTGQFSHQQISGPMGFTIFAVGDVNGDGLPDIVVPDRFGVISVILGQKQRQIPSVFPYTPDVAGVVTAGDINGDGKPDLLVPSDINGYPGTSYLNQGGGQFQLAGSPSYEGLVLADLNGDGLAEMIGSDGVNILIWKGTGDPNFASAPIVIPPPPNVGFEGPQMQIADMNGDGLPDIVLPGVILYNQGNLSFSAVPLNFGGTSGPFLIGDFNHDGILDIVTGDITLLGQPNGTFVTVASSGLGLTFGVYLAAGDFNQDGNLDVVLGGNEEPMIVYYGRGDGTFYVQSELNVGPISDYSQALVVGDFNGDGRPDILACLFYSEQCVVYTNNGQGGFQRSYFASGTNAVALLATDLTGDGNPDLVIANYALDYRPPNFNVVLHK
jgi:hypothetical protein